MAGRQCCRGNGSGTLGGTLAAAAVGGALAAGMAGNRSAARSAEVMAAEEQDSETMLQEDMPMCRHVNLTTTTTGYCCVEKQLRELNQVLDYQNKILAELLRAVREQAERT